MKETNPAYAVWGYLMWDGLRKILEKSTIEFWQRLQNLKYEKPSSSKLSKFLHSS